MLRAPAGLFAGAFALFSFLAGPGAAQQIQPLRAEIEYRAIKAQPVQVSGAIEVVDFFWYGCPYCNQLQPALEGWISRQPADVTVSRIPAILRDSWAPHARIYYTLEALGEVKRLHQRVYHSYHVEKLSMSKPEVVSEWAARHGIPRARWDQAYSSAAAQRKTEETAQLTRIYDITGTPSLVVNGGYLTSGNMAESPGGVIPMLDGLVRLARDQTVSR